MSIKGNQNHKEENLPALHQEQLTPFEKRIWPDVEPGKYSLSDYEISKKLIHLLRHGQHVHREDDGAIEFWRIKENLQTYFHHFKEEETKSVGELSKVCSQIVLKCFNLARIGRPDILWSVNKLARSITKWTKACDKRLNRLISYIHHTCEYKQFCYVGNTSKQCRLGLFQDSNFAGDLEDSKSTSGGTLCIFGSHTFVPISWMCKKQTAVSHSSTESEIISLWTLD